MGTPSYVRLHANGELRNRARKAISRLSACRCCPHACDVDRLADERGVCGIGRHAMVSSYGPHFGEEPPLVGSRGSGAVFFSGCNMDCDYCQNHEVSRGLEGVEMEGRRLADVMLHLQEMGCHNINLVSPSHVVPQILEAVDLAAADGLRLPLVYNSGGYDSVDALRLLDGVIDIYMPDAKYDDPEVAERLSHVERYPELMHDALREMHRQVGDLCTEEGLAVRGMIVRHLVLPERLAGTEGVMGFVADELSRESYVNIMGQYRPEHRVLNSPHPWHLPLRRTVRREEMEDALRSAVHHGLRVER